MPGEHCQGGVRIEPGSTVEPDTLGHGTFDDDTKSDQRLANAEVKEPLDEAAPVEPTPRAWRRYIGVTCGVLRIGHANARRIRHDLVTGMAGWVVEIAILEDQEGGSSSPSSRTGSPARSSSVSRGSSSSCPALAESPVPG